MSDSVQMPALGESVTEGTVTRWLKQVGDRVEVDEPLLEVSTDKVDTEIPSPVAGVLEEILVNEDETVDVGAALARIGDGSGGGSAAPAQEEAPAQEDSAQEDSAPEDAPGQEEAAPEQPAQQNPPAEAEESGAEESQEQPAAKSGGGSGGDGQRVSMPALGESVTEGTVTRWLKQVGDSVEVDEPLLEVSTDKVDTEIPSPVAGVVQQILVNEDETVEVGADLVVIGSGAPAAEPAQESPKQAEPEQKQAEPEQKQPEQKPEQKEPEQAPPAEASTAQAPPPAEAPAEQAPPAKPEQPAAADANGASGDGGGYVTPLVRRMAAEQGVDLSKLAGTGVGGRIRKQDVIDAAKAKEAEQPAPAEEPAPAEQPAPAKQPAPAADRKKPEISALRGTTVKMSRLRKVIAQRMVESLQTSAQLTTVVEVDVTRIARLRDRAKADFATREGVKLSFLPFFALATVEALKQHPTVNAMLEGDEVVYHPQENLGIAVDTEKGLIVPVIKDAGDLNIAGLARRIADLADRTRKNKVTPDELGGGTFTLTNTGSRGALFDTPIINQPQVGILGTGAVVKRPVVVADADGAESISVRSMVYLALSYDHRIVDGADAARFLMTMKERLEEGAFDADLGL